VGLRKHIADGLAIAVFVAILWVGVGSLLHAPASAVASGNSVLDRAFSPEVLQVIRLGLVVFAAFVGAALVQRTILGKFGFKVGPIELAELEDLGPVLAPAIKKVGDDFKEELEKLSAETNARFEALNIALQELDATLVEFDSRIQALEAKE
jgi:hypothetical protein